MFGRIVVLARNNLLPSIYDLTHRGLLPPIFGLVGFGRRDWSDDDFADYVRTSVAEHSRTGFDENVFEQLRGGLRFVTGTFGDTAAFEKLTAVRSGEHTSELQSRGHLVCRLLLDNKKSCGVSGVYSSADC